MKLKLDITPVSFAFEQNYPNPFNPSTAIKYSLAEQSKVVIKVFNSLGEQVELITNDIQEAGTYQLIWDATNFSSGVYFYSVEASLGDGSKTYKEVKKMLLLK